MGLIHVLDARVADQIAAGEVVERPSSVVKELVENAVDAGASEIEVQLVDGGVGRITVIDNGRGMAADDAVLCFSRHATSKLRDVVDLQRIGTFGFRGEALAAIASVAQVRLLTRPHDAALATEVRVAGGSIAHVGEAGAPVGTRLDVEQLFFNVPARRKFLKSMRTEAGHVEDALLGAALFHPALAVRLVVDGKLVLDVPPVPTDAPLSHPARVDRAVRCLGAHVRPLLFPLSSSTDLLQVRGYVVAPLETRRDLAGVHLAVNQRPVADRALVQAVRAAFRTLLEVGRQPIVALDLHLPPEFVDVNVHPRKAEVRFSDPRRVSGHLIALLSDFLATTPWLDRSGASAAGAAPVASRAFAWRAATPTSPHDVTATTTRLGASANAGAAGTAGTAGTVGNVVADEHRARVRAALSRFSATTGAAHRDVPMHAASERAGAGPFLVDEQDAPAVRTTPGRGGAPSFSSLRVVGQIGRTYLVLEGPQGMVVIDQHAAHERVVFERLRAQRRAGGARAQPLLFPSQIELSSMERAALADDDVRSELLRHGLDVEAFGGTSAIVKAMPPGLDDKKAATIVRDALAELARSGTAHALDERSDAICARLACHTAVRAGDALAAEAVRALLVELDAIDLGAHCPHGRPVVRTVALGELASWFHRG